MVPRSDAQSTTGRRAAPLDAAALARLVPSATIRGRNVSKADVRFYSVRGVEIAVKDYGGRPLIVRNTVGRFLVRRECAAYEAAAGVPGLPEFHGRIGAFALATGRVDGRPLSALDRAEVDPALFDRLAEVLDSFHRRGIALADLHHRDVLVGAGGEVHVVDLATALVAGRGAGPLRRALFRLLRDLDRVSLARMRARWSGRDEREAVVAAAGRGAAAMHASGRRVKALWDRLRGRASR